MPKPTKAPEKVEIEPGAEKRLANILKKALNTPPVHRSKPDRKSPKSKPKRLSAGNQSV
jgi:hypothetical protein